MEYLYKKRYALSILSLFFIWGGISYQWYVCGIKQFCGQLPAPQGEQTAAAGAFGGGVTDTEPVQRFQQRAQKNETYCEQLITAPLVRGGKNDAAETIRLQQFLNAFEGESLVLDGIYDQADTAAVARFQIKYRDAILAPVGLRKPTGRVSFQTMNAINSLYCMSMIKQ